MALFEKSFDAKNKERTQSIIFRVKAWTVYYLLVYVGLILAIPMEYLARFGMNNNFMTMLGRYFELILSTGGLYIFRYYVYSWLPSLFNHPDIYHGIIFVPLLTFPVGKYFIGKLNPYKTKFSKVYGAGRKATWEDLDKVKILKDGFIFVLGKLKGKFIKLNETFSVMCFAPPGTGKTAGIVVPTLLENDTVSMIVNDPKPEIAKLTSGYRATVGTSFAINWGKTDDPTNGIYYPSWNPLAPDSIPPLGPERDMYIESMVNVMIQDNSVGGETYWSTAGRNALTGFIHLIVSKVERARANDYFLKRMEDFTFDTEDARLLASYYMSMEDNLASGAMVLLREGDLNASNYVPVGTWDNIPIEWLGKEACFPMMLDLITALQIGMAENISKRKEMGDYSAGQTDTMKEILQNLVREGKRFNYSRRSIQELTKLANAGEKERASVISTFLTEINIFNNEAVRQRTTRNDVKFKYLRGMIDPKDGVMKPVTVYLEVNQTDAKALGKISAIFIELMSRYLISNPPESESERDGKMGPCPVMFVLDEFPQMPKLDAVINGPAIGRGMKVSYLLIGQDLNQIGQRYGKEEVETMISNTAAKIIFQQNNDEPAKRFEKLVGYLTEEKKTTEKGWDALWEEEKDGKKNIETKKSLEKSRVISADDMLKIEFGKHYVIVQGAMDYPIEAETPLWFKDDKLKEKVEIPASSPLPEKLI
ncbi:MAG: type IV secretory system conjugative DNA transfer family protein [Rickettsiales bacterium]|jgi:type IV secretory pathway TraG/TraD family ATPase VirD4|nr:type IV secretory system conjugative DNA transfer family protein [Rickettsiales bacterium]